jgi:hypothetical protein
MPNRLSAFPGRWMAGITVWAVSAIPRSQHRHALNEKGQFAVQNRSPKLPMSAKWRQWSRKPDRWILVDRRLYIRQGSFPKEVLIGSQTLMRKEISMDLN